MYIYMYIVNLYPRDRVSYPTKTLSFLQDAVPMAPLPPTAHGGKMAARCRQCRGGRAECPGIHEQGSKPGEFDNIYIYIYMYTN